MQTSSEKLLGLAGLQFDQSEADRQDGLSALIWSMRHAPDDIAQRQTAVELDNALAEFLLCVFELDQAMLDRRHAYAVSGIGCQFSQTALSCQTLDGTDRWLRLRLILDISWDAVLAGDMQPYPETLVHEFNARGIEFSIAG